MIVYLRSKYVLFRICLGNGKFVRFNVYGLSKSKKICGNNFGRSKKF